MIRKIYLNRQLPFPVVSLTLIATCLLVSLSVHFVSEYDAVLNALDPVAYWWQRFTTLFAHGGYWGIPIGVHLTGNLTGILVFSILCERVLSPKKYWRFFLISLSISVLAFYSLKVTGNGISSIVWSFIPTTAYTLYVLVKRHRKNITLLPVIVIAALVVWGVIIYPQVYGNNNFHNLGVLVGVVFTLMWSREIERNINGIILNDDMVTSTTQYKRKLYVLVIPIFILSIMIMTRSGLIQTVKPVEIQPKNHSSIEAIIKEGNRIEFKFDKDMNSNSSFLRTSSEFDVGARVRFVDSRTVQIEFTKNIEGSEYINIVGDFATIDGFRYPVKLSYVEE